MIKFATHGDIETKFEVMVDSSLNLLQNLPSLLQQSLIARRTNIINGIWHHLLQV